VEVRESKIALITGITGQDGSYLAELLLQKGYEVHGIRRRSSSFNTKRIEPLLSTGLLSPDNLHYGDISDFSSIFSILTNVQPTEVYHLAAQSHVGVSFENPEYTGNIDALGTLRMLEAIRMINPTGMRFYQASTSELYGKNQNVPQNEDTLFMPCSPYAIAKAYAFNIATLYRDAYGVYACNGILFNHESPRRGETFVSRKITRHVASYYKGSKKVLVLGNLDAVRDWGHAKDYVEGMFKIINYSIPDNFVLSTGRGNTVRKFVETSFEAIGIQVQWQGVGLKEVGVDTKTGRLLVEVSDGYMRPSEVPTLIGDSTKARKLLGWEPKISFEELVDEMVRSDINSLAIT
jgi:GDPmannose 4,6-dehydratase